MKRTTTLSLAIALSLGVSAAAQAESVVVSTGLPGGSYADVFGKNLVSLLREQGHDATVMNSGGSLDNIENVVNGTAQIGFTQADAWMASKQTQLKVLGALGQECIYVATTNDIKNEDDLEGKRIAVGGQGSGSAKSWEYAQQLEKDYQKTSTHYIGDFEALGALQTGQVDAFLWVASPSNLNSDYLKAVRQSDQIHLIDFDDYDMNEKLPGGKQVYTFQDVVVDDSGWDEKIETACTDLIVIGNPDADAGLIRDVSKAVMMNGNRIRGE